MWFLSPNFKDWIELSISADCDFYHHVLEASAQGCQEQQGIWESYALLECQYPFAEQMEYPGAAQIAVDLSSPKKFQCTCLYVIWMSRLILLSMELTYISKIQRIICLIWKQTPTFDQVNYILNSTDKSHQMN